MVLLDLLIPARCAGCGARGLPCCDRCAAVWGAVSEVVRVPVAGLVRVFALSRYRGLGRRLLIAFKERGRRDLAAPLGLALARALVVLPVPGSAVCLVPAPSRRSAARVRGGPHVELLALAAARVLAGWGFEVAVAPALELAGGARDAVGLDRAARVANLAGRLRFREAGRPPPGMPVVVLDDVITTGATAAACVRALAGEGIEVAAVLTLLAAG
ncbi:Predicted amidophosphoribosyltransferases [Amycolatopsis pretoriensis]|uniref:Predicted amidophosphoribosyltransferases n=1 Tax=Amycolatopsis pretoriensis TaxID=218821 RepID=A0A1H5QNZ9_9PSEU|nr:ComF family protein [Amycolatopsis pretoriensis]SEF26937.1 Predicted amidophosphoribosyltransferases [Amycolatopsis pretoriensis]